jgi:hypothetical protein
MTINLKHIKRADNTGDETPAFMLYIFKTAISQNKGFGDIPKKLDEAEDKYKGVQENLRWFVVTRLLNKF